MSVGSVQTRWVGHKQHGITALQLMECPVSVVSGSMDKQVRLWDIQGKSYGGIHMTKLNHSLQWTFPFDWMRPKLEQMEKVFDTLEFLEKTKEKKTQQQKDEIKYNYLINKYFNGSYSLPSELPCK